MFLIAVNDFDNYFAPKVCIGIIRYTFFQRKQEKEEPNNGYTATFRKRSLDCKFGNC